MIHLSVISRPTGHWTASPLVNRRAFTILAEASKLISACRRKHESSNACLSKHRLHRVSRSPEEGGISPRQGALPTCKRHRQRGRPGQVGQADPSRERLPRAVCGSNEKQIGSIAIPAYVLEDERRVLTVSGCPMASRWPVAGPRSRASTASSCSCHATGSGLSCRIPGAGFRPIVFLTRLVREPTATTPRSSWNSARRSSPRARRRASSVAGGHRPARRDLMRGLARVGIVALVDEATGYQEIRDVPPCGASWRPTS